MNHRCTLALFALSALTANVESQTTSPAQIDDSKPYRFSTNVNLVVLNATVRDKRGWFVSDLAQSDFQVYEDGVAQAIRLFRHEDIPVTVGLVVDHSGSMWPKLAEVIAASRTFVESSRPDDDMFVVNFNERVTVELAGKNHSNRPDQLARALSSRPTIGKTALYDAVFEGLQQLHNGAREKRVLIVISDGGDNASRSTLAGVLRAVEQSNVLVYAIGVFDEDDPDRNANVLRRLARVTGGEAFFPKQLNEVVSICDHIARDIRNQYTVGYVSSKVERPGVYRPIRVIVRAAGQGKLVVRTKSGYISDDTPK
jgi:VWFA-related protein